MRKAARSTAGSDASGKRGEGGYEPESADDEGIDAAAFWAACVLVNGRGPPLASAAAAHVAGGGGGL